MLKLKNYIKMENEVFTCNETEWKVVAIVEQWDHYIITTLPKESGVWAIYRKQSFKLWRNRLSSTFSNGYKIDWIGRLSDRDRDIHINELKSPNWFTQFISTRFLSQIC